MPKHSQNKFLRIQKDISNLMQQGKSSREIMNLLHIPLSSYRRYTTAIHEQDKQVWYDLVKGEVATELLRLRASIQETFTKTRELANTPDLCTGDVLAALQAKDDAKISIIKLTQLPRSWDSFVTCEW